MENPFVSETAPAPRPAFLTVLCILTFVGSGWAVLSNLFSLFLAGAVNQSVQVEQYANMAGGLEGANAGFMTGFLSSSVELMQALALHAREIAVINLVLALASVIGAVLMFFLRRAGFPLYVVAQLLMLFVTPYFGGFSSVVLLGMFFSGALTLLFIVLYAVNLKHLR